MKFYCNIMIFALLSLHSLVRLCCPSSVRLCCTAHCNFVPYSIPVLSFCSWWVGAIGSSAEPDGYEKVYSVISGMFSKLEMYAMVPDPQSVAANERRLKALKTKYDPGNLFVNNPCNIIPDTAS